ncbi:sensor histidine kinase [Gracilibacillus salinarum]|uniref:histidine kinase n=1 Tax=Gracilibacillus salinarum TaxID=2932255 RepID=A0ABY4GIU4_9BACI|nr:sensor histidine kinase [Gracilibacillus salinarum]UOQ84111.1 sensor histidine kinase [Gracilibacillus salinarum]
MIKIRTKLLMYFLAVLSLVIVIIFVQEKSTQRMVTLQDESSEHNYMLNEITNQTDQVFQSLQIYVHEPTEDNLAFYQKDSQALASLQAQFNSATETSTAKENYYHMLSSFLELTDKTVEGVQQEDIDRYSAYLNEADDTATYIHEKTLELINQELSRYQNILVLEDQRVTYTKNMGTSIFIAIIIGSLLFALWFSNGITKVIDKLTNAAKEISQGNYSVADVEVEQNDELNLLTQTFNQMKLNIVEAFREMKEKARLRQLLKEMELKSLQNQINPHFLFNTLNTVSKLAYIEGAERTSDLISAVSALLRYNIGSLDRETYLKDEVNIVNEYFFIQQTRFRDRVTFHQEIDESCLLTPIPCLTLQPIMENAFMHGIEEMAEGATIMLRISPVDDMVQIDITDNGVGMDQQTIDQLIQKEEKKESEQQRKGHSTGIGMRNVMDRLHLFHPDSQLSIESEVGKGTTVTILLPKGGIIW